MSATTSPQQQPAEQTAPPPINDVVPTQDDQLAPPQPTGEGDGKNGGPFGKLFVGQVPAVCNEEMLMPLFAPYGALLEIKIMRDTHGRSKGCAWVRYETQAQAQAAIEALHEKHAIPPQTNMLQVRYAQTRHNAGGPGEEGGDFRSSRRDGSGSPHGGRGGYGRGRGRGGGGDHNAGGNNPYANNGSFGQQPTFAAGGIYNNNQMFGWNQPQQAGFGVQQGNYAQGQQGNNGGFDQYAWPPAVAGQNAAPKMKRSPPGSSCFVGNLPPSLNIPDLKTLFQPELPPNVSIVNSSIHRDRRFGFITFGSPEEANMAASKLHNFTVGENRIRVEVTQNEPRYTHQQHGQGGQQPPQQQQQPIQY